MGNYSPNVHGTLYIEFERMQFDGRDLSFWYVHDGLSPEHAAGPFETYQDAANWTEYAADQSAVQLWVWHEETSRFDVATPACEILARHEEDRKRTMNTGGQHA